MKLGGGGMMGIIHLGDVWATRRWVFEEFRHFEKRKEELEGRCVRNPE